MIRFWGWIKRFAEQRERDAWLSKYYCDQKCPHCDTWQANCGGWRKIERNSPTDQHDTCTCGKCGQVTVFRDIGIGFIAEPEWLTSKHRGAPCN